MFCFFLLGIVLDLGQLLVFALLHLPLLPWGVLFPILGPTFAAFLVTSVIEKKPGVFRLLRRCVLWREGTSVHHGARSGATSGMVTKKVVPSPSSDSNQMVIKAKSEQVLGRRVSTGTNVRGKTAPYLASSIDTL